MKIYDRLHGYEWPGNIRELRNVLERAALLAENGCIGSQHLSFQLQTSGTHQQNLDLASMTTEQLEALHIAAVLKRCRGGVEEAALQLGISRSTLYSRIKHYNLS